MVDVSNDHLRMTLPKNPNATDISFHVEQTIDLANPAWSVNGTSILQNTATLLQVQDSNLVDGSETAGYLRLRVSEP